MIILTVGCDSNNNAVTIGAVAGVNCVVIIIMVITNIMVWIYCFRKKHHTGTVNPVYHIVTNSHYKETKLAEEPNSYYEEVNKPPEVKMTLDPAYAAP